MLSSSGQKQLNTVHALISYFCTAHLNIKFPSKPKYLLTFSERTLIFFRKALLGTKSSYNCIPSQQIVVVLSAKKIITFVLLGQEVTSKTTEGISTYRTQQRNRRL
jgi:hypothetical protein